MFNHSFKLQTDYFLELFNDLPRYKHHSQLYGFTNHPVWILGHLAYSYSLTNSILTNKKEDLRKWKSLFGTGSRPIPIITAYPNTKELVDSFKNQRDELAYSSRNLTLAHYIKENNAQCYKDSLPTLGDLLSYTMIGHTGYHVGQLVAYRTIHGLPRIPEKFDVVKTDKTGDSKFECPFCDSKFTKRSAYSKHLKSSHKNGK